MPSHGEPINIAHIDRFGTVEPVAEPTMKRCRERDDKLAGGLECVNDIKAFPAQVDGGS